MNRQPKVSRMYMLHVQNLKQQPTGLMHVCFEYAESEATAEGLGVKQPLTHAARGTAAILPESRS